MFETNRSKPKRLNSGESSYMISAEVAGVARLRGDRGSDCVSWQCAKRLRSEHHETTYSQPQHNTNTCWSEHTFCLLKMRVSN